MEWESTKAEWRKWEKGRINKENKFLCPTPLIVHALAATYWITEENSKHQH
jgi:hypothetical protein